MFSALKAARTLAADTGFCLVTVTETKGSTPRDVDAVMAVTEGQIFGSIGGGNLEMDAIDKARNLLKTCGEKQVHHAILGPDMEQCCGGAVTYTLEIVDMATALKALQCPSLTPIYLFGAGHVGTALILALLPLPFQVFCYDARSEKSTQTQLSSRPPRRDLDLTADNEVPGQARDDNVKISPLLDISETILSAPKNTIFIIMTHDHNLDYELVHAVLERDDFAFLGLIGSKTKRARFISRLKKDGFGDRQISRLTCPIGIEGIKGKEPEIIAASVAAQLLQMRTNNGD